MKYFISIIEYGIMNNDWPGWKMGRIEVYRSNKTDRHYAIYEGFIRLPEKAFDALREELDYKDFDKLPYLRFDYVEKED